MKICIYGAGAIGGFLAAYLTNQGHEVSVISRGANLKAFKNNGLTLKHGTKTFTVYPKSTQKSNDIGPVDVIFVTVKGPALIDVGRNIAPLLKANTQVVFAMNGIPWWYDLSIESTQTTASILLDPDRYLQQIVGINRVIGCVVDCPAIVQTPGVIVSSRESKGKFTVGAPRSTENINLEMISEIIETAGMLAPITNNIEHAIWDKLIVNLSRSPIAVLTGADELELAKNSETTSITKEMVQEACSVACAHGIQIDLNWKQLLNPEYRSEHRSSMLQDWDAQRPMEIDSIVKIVSIFAKEASLKTPTIDRILALLILKARKVGLYH